MGYQRKEALSGPLLTVEQARRRNTELRLELARLAAENAQLEPQIDTLRTEVSRARKLLTRKVRELEAARTQAEHLARVQVVTHAEPIHGGQAGLIAATEEIEAYAIKLDKLGRRRRIVGPSHGTRKRYGKGCRCDDCMDWRRKASDRERVNQQRRRETAEMAA
jgi:chromosome segregation ATPase